jgi:hypothetical protein
MLSSALAFFKFFPAAGFLLLIAATLAGFVPWLVRMFCSLHNIRDYPKRSSLNERGCLEADVG